MSAVHPHIPTTHEKEDPMPSNELAAAITRPLPAKAAVTCHGHDGDTSLVWRKGLCELRKRVQPAHDAVRERLAEPRVGDRITIEQAVSLLMDAERILYRVICCPCAVTDDPGAIHQVGSRLAAACSAAQFADTAGLTFERRRELRGAVRLMGDAMWNALDTAVRTPEPGMGGSVLHCWEEVDRPRLRVILRAAEIGRERARASEPNRHRAPVALSA